MVRYSALKGLYDVEKTIGCGGFAKVKLATHVATGEKVAIKIMNKAILGDDLHRVKLELKALKTLSHQHICKLYQVIETETHFFIVVEYCSGGELFDHIVEKTRLSESESKNFFRQIVSAVAYLHSFGYIHRDLKPENVLLDGDQQLKLIDFGLCARPEGGVQTPLYTSCGSPTYAAPELVLGRQYLGPEVDVWAMGVLLYALLSGFLPFDDQNIDQLYKKILSGKYEEPIFMSMESKKLIRAMLQVNPKHRITIPQLLKHSWLSWGAVSASGASQNPLANGILKGQCFKTFDEDCVDLMAQYHKISTESMWKHIKKWRYDYDTATYLLLMARKKRGMPLRMNAVPHRIRCAANAARGTKACDPQDVPPPLPPRNVLTPKKSANGIRENGQCKKALEFSAGNGEKVDSGAVSAPNSENVPPGSNGTPSTPGRDNFLEPRKPGSIRKPLKRLRSPNLDGECSPVPIKVTPGRVATPTIVITPDKNASGSARKVLGTIERSLHKVRHVLTPRKNAEIPNVPVTLNSKNMCNVSTTSCRDPEFVITELTKALQKKGIHCERKGFRLRGKMEPNKYRFGGCSFELEICLLPTMGAANCGAGAPPDNHHALRPRTPSTPGKNTHTAQQQTRTPVKSSMKHGTPVPPASAAPPACVGIRRKRLKGDSWCYKRVCEQVLALTAADLGQQIGSPV